MGGDIVVESEYGKGSTFTITLPQTIRDREKLATVENPAEKHVLLYENRDIYSDSVVCTVDNLGVECTTVSSDAELREELAKGNYAFVFIAPALYENAKDICKTYEKVVEIVLLTEFGETVNEENLRMLAMPVHSISVANILNNAADDFSYGENSGSAVRFTAPDANIVIVDDINTNLIVAEGLLAPYGMKIKLCSSGPEAIGSVSAKEYDIVFMDHMMPGMDGIEATAQIRAMAGEKPYCKNMPIIALTANAVAGTKELFLDNGFNDFLSKPIDTVKMNSILEKWIPAAKKKSIAVKNDAVQEHGDVQEIEIEGLDAKKGLAMTGGKATFYHHILALFRKDAEDRLPLLQTVPEANALLPFVTQVHALKGTSASIGATEVSALAAGLETAGKAGDMMFIKKQLPVFAEHLAKLVEGIRAWETAGAASPAAAPAATDKTEMLSLLDKLSAELKAQKAEEIDNVLEEIDQVYKTRQPQNPKFLKYLEKISDDVLMTEFDNAIKTVDEFSVELRGEGDGTH
jgi:CheY-like chemotaxis protein/HPt (histidine-containing phosphotransfer) domain-containing protein